MSTPTIDHNRWGQVYSLLLLGRDDEAARLAAKWGWPDGALGEARAQAEPVKRKRRADAEAHVAKVRAEAAQWDAVVAAGLVKQYRVQVTRTQTRSVTVTVEARNAEEAEECAIGSEAADVAFSRYDRYEYDTDDETATVIEPEATTVEAIMARHDHAQGIGGAA